MQLVSELPLKKPSLHDVHTSVVLHAEHPSVHCVEEHTLGHAETYNDMLRYVTHHIFFHNTKLFKMGQEAI